MDLGHWQAENLEWDDDVTHFVYEISKKEPIEGKPYRYIGQKTIKRKKKYPPLKNKTRNRWIEKETDWKKYQSSSRELQDQIKEFGKESFDFKILKLCYGKSEANYFETWLQFQKNALFDESYYNGIINCRIGKFKLHPNQIMELPN